MIHKKIIIWKKGTYQSEGEDGFQPAMDTYILDGCKKRGAVLICPGGGYEFTSSREAEPIAMQFNAAGFHAFVLYYSVAPRRHPQPLLDVSRAICLIRENANEWNIEIEKIAICGFSAGGHLAASIGVHWDKSYLNGVCGITEGMNRPNALILCYPVITSGQFAHRSSFEKLLGMGANNELLFEMSLEHQISSKTPPAFIWHTYEDALVPIENSLFFAKEMRAHNVPFELHVYADGQHGMALATSETAEEDNYEEDVQIATWFKLCTGWLGKIFK